MPQSTRSFLSTPLSGLIAGALLAAALSAPAVAQNQSSAEDQERQEVQPLSLKIQQDRDVRTPRRGEVMDSVERRFGEPRDVKGPVGDPPITRWQYADFEVVFEEDTVIHTVIEPDSNG